MELPKESEIQWLEFGNHNADGRVYVKRDEQWYEIWHTQGWVDGGNKVTKEKIKEAIAGIPAHLARNRHTKGWTAEWGKESLLDKDYIGYFMVGEVPWAERDKEEEKCSTSIKEILQVIDDDNFDEWLASKYPENW